MNFYRRCEVSFAISKNGYRYFGSTNLRVSPDQEDIFVGVKICIGYAAARSWTGCMRCSAVFCFLVAGGSEDLLRGRKIAPDDRFTELGSLCRAESVAMLSAKICWFRDYEEPKVMPEGTAKAKMEAAVVELVHIARTKICIRKARNTDKLTREKRSSAYPNGTLPIFGHPLYAAAT
ncbi:hypothetical protein KL934_001550 [Ogataea polymorpha]|nr:hypothetical protein KL934_001550 [Ogataea polymorpha]